MESDVTDRPVQFVVASLAPVRRGGLLAALTKAVVAIVACSTVAFGASTIPELPSSYRPEELAGRWGLAAYVNVQDRPRVEELARAQCSVAAYNISVGPTGGVMMHLANQAQPQELRLKRGRDGKNYIGLPGEAGAAQDREIVAFDGHTLVTSFVDPKIASVYANMVYVKCE